MVGDVEPVANLPAVAVDRQVPALERVGDHERDQLLRELVRPVVVRAVGRDRGKAVGVVIGAHQVVGAGLGSRVGAVGRVGRGLGKGRIALAEAAVHLVGRDMQEAERGLRVGGERAPIGARCLEQLEGTHHVGLHEGRGAVDRAVDVALGCEVHDRARLVGREQALEGARVGDVAAHEDVARIARERGEVREVARIGELVEVHHRLAFRGDPVEDEIGADEPGTAGHEDGHCPPAFCSSMSFKYLWNELLQPITMCANPGPPSRKPRRSR